MRTDMLICSKKSWKVVLWVLLFTCWFPSLGEAQSKIDSLKQLASTTTNDSLRGEAYLALARMLSWREPESALAYMDTLQELPDYKSMLSWQAWSKYYIGDAYLTLSNLEQGKDYASEAIVLFEELKDSLGLATANYQLGKKAYMEGDWPTAIERQQHTKKLYEALNHTQGVAACINLLGSTYFKAEMYDDAIAAYQEAYDLFEEAEVPNGMASNLSNIGTIYAQQKVHGKAIDYFFRALEIFEEYGHSTYSIANTKSNLADPLYEAGRYEESIQYGMDAYQYYKTAESNNLAGLSLVSVALSNQKLGNSKLALQQFDEVFELMDQEIPDYDRLSIAAIQASHLHQEVGNYKKGYEYLSLYNNYQDSILNKEILVEINELKTKYETEKKEAEIERLALKDELSQTQLSRRNRTIFGLAAGVLLLGGLLFQNFRQIKQIKSQNNIISRALREKETLLREIHHRVKNNLQVISSLLGIQYAQVEDEKTKEAIQEGRNRVYSMALIHQNLYQKDNLSGIEMSNYLDKLCRNLLHTYNTSEANVELTTDVDPLKLDVDTVVPIGLIINELMTNALKYAFPEQQAGTIAVSLKDKKDHLVLSLADNGVGLQVPATADPNQAQNESFGHSLIQAFKEKLDADISFISDQGTKVELLIRDYTIVT